MTPYFCQKGFEKVKCIRGHRVGSKRDLNFYVLSRQHFNLIKNRRKKLSRSVIRGGHVNPSKPATCQCNILNRGSIRNKYLITAQVVRVKKSLFQPMQQFRELISKRGFLDRAGQARLLGAHFRLVKVTGIFSWARVRPFVDYLENFNVDKSDMCGDVARTVEEIQRGDSLYF